jgi:3-oxoacyl-[acyl-carrier-protein] synthase II
MALERAKLTPKDINYICTNANSTQDADLVEANALKEVFRDSVRNIAVSSIKSMIGDTYSAAGSLSVIAALGAIQNNFVPPTINYAEKDKRIDLNLVVNKAKKTRINTAMINTFGPNGANSSLIIRRYK